MLPEAARKPADAGCSTTGSIMAQQSTQLYVISDGQQDSQSKPKVKYQILS
jgi:hypothetical protein